MTKEHSGNGGRSTGNERGALEHAELAREHLLGAAAKAQRGAEAAWRPGDHLEAAEALDRLVADLGGR